MPQYQVLCISLSNSAFSFSMRHRRTGKAISTGAPTGMSTKQKTVRKIQDITAFRHNPMEHNSSAFSMVQQPNIGPWPPVLHVSRHVMFSERGCEPLAQSSTWRTRSPYLWSPETGWPSYTPWHWAARDLGSATSRTHNNCESLRPMVHNYSDKRNSSRRHNPLWVCIHSPFMGFSLLYRGF